MPVDYNGVTVRFLIGGAITDWYYLKPIGSIVRCGCSYWLEHEPVDVSS